MTVALITGCSTGIGYATALRLAKEGYTVVATMRDPSSCDLSEHSDIDVRALDVDDDAAVDALFASVISDHDAIDVLVNNAGVGGGNNGVEETALEDYRSVLETNFFGALRCTKAVLPSMRERGRGRIVNVTSQAGLIAYPGMSAYCASKAALEAATESLAIEVAPFGIRVALIEPGAIMTAIWTKVDVTPPTGPYAPIRKRLGHVVMTDLAQASTADEVADCIAEAISTDTPRLRWLTGQGAERNVANRRSWTDEEYIALWNDPDRHEFTRRMFAEPT